MTIGYYGPLAVATATRRIGLPSRGDTCFASLAPLGDNLYRVYNFASPLDGPDLTWIAGQIQPTRIYAVTLAIP